MMYKSSTQLISTLFQEKIVRQNMNMHPSINALPLHLFQISGDVECNPTALQQYFYFNTNVLKIMCALFFLHKFPGSTSSSKDVNIGIPDARTRGFYKYKTKLISYDMLKKNMSSQKSSIHPKENNVTFPPQISDTGPLKNVFTHPEKDPPQKNI